MAVTGVAMATSRPGSLLLADHTVVTVITRQRPRRHGHGEGLAKDCLTFSLLAPLLAPATAWMPPVLWRRVS